MNPKIIAASVAALLVAAGLFVYLGTGIEPAEAIQPAAAEAGFAGQEAYEAEPWLPAPGMPTLADASIDALHEISVGASPSEALKKASSSRSLALNGQLEDMFGPEAVENCELKYWFMTDSFVNACSPYESFFGGAPPTWQPVTFGGPLMGQGVAVSVHIGQLPLAGVTPWHGAWVSHTGVVIGQWSGSFLPDGSGVLHGTFSTNIGGVVQTSDFTASPWYNSSGLGASTHRDYRTSGTWTDAGFTGTYVDMVSETVGPDTTFGGGITANGGTAVVQGIVTAP